jgi:hypothetical protein
MFTNGFRERIPISFIFSFMSTNCMLMLSIFEKSILSLFPSDISMMPKSLLSNSQAVSSNPRTDEVLSRTSKTERDVTNRGVTVKIVKKQ